MLTLRTLTALSLTAALALAAFHDRIVPSAHAEEPWVVEGAKPLAPQPSPDTLKPGLAVTYYYVMVRDVADISRIVSGSKGTPVALLDMDTDSGKVLTSSQNQGVGAELRGAIHLDTPGEYLFKLLSNDGVKLEIGGELIWEDPTVHADTWSDPVKLIVTEAGWYDFTMDYYQRKGTSALRLVWTKPGGTEEVVPASAYAHFAE